MITYRRDEITNKHGQYIAYWSKQKGNTELEKYRNFSKDGTEYIIPDKQGLDMTCIVDPSEGPEGFCLVCFNSLGETIFQTEDCYGTEKDDVTDTLYNYDVL